MFVFTDKTEEYFENGKFEEAFGVLDGRYRLGEELRNAPFLLKHCVSLMATENDYEETKGQLKTLIQNLHPLSKTVLWLAKKFHKLGHYFAALIVFEIFFEIFYEVGGSYVSLEVIEDCMSGIKNTVSTMVESEDNFQPFVRRCILPKMYAMKNTYLQINDVNPQYKCVKLGWITHAIEICETNSQERLRVISDAIRYMREVLGESVLKHQIFGTLCNNLASTYLKLGRNPEAIQYYEEALLCFRAATDFQINYKRQKYIKDTESALRRAQGVEEEIGIEIRRGDDDQMANLMAMLNSLL